MHEITVTLETVTPMFLGGAEPRGAPPELRPPSFRGAMRYWLRATLGGVVGDHNLDGLHKLESAVFGSTEIGSPISLSLRGNPAHSVHSILPHKPNSGKREAFDSIEEINLVLRAKPITSELVWENACMALNLTLLFGGVGLRSRRGFGSLRVIKTSDPKLIPITPQTMEKENWINRIRWVLGSAISLAKRLAEDKGIPIVPLPTSPTDFPCAAQDGIVRVVKLGKGSSEETLVNMMSVMPQVNYLGGISPRQSSPLWIRVFWADKSYHLLMCVLPSKLVRNSQNYDNVKNFLDSKFPGTELKIQGWNTL